MARLATTWEKLVASGPNPVALATPQVATSSPDCKSNVMSLFVYYCLIMQNSFCQARLLPSLTWDNHFILPGKWLLHATCPETSFVKNICRTLTSLIIILITSPLTWTNVVPFCAVDILFLGKQMYLPSSEQLAGPYIKHELLPRKWMQTSK